MSRTPTLPFRKRNTMMCAIFIDTNYLLAHMMAAGGSGVKGMVEKGGESYMDNGANLATRTLRLLVTKNIIYKFFI